MNKTRRCTAAGGFFIGRFQRSPSALRRGYRELSPPDCRLAIGSV